MHTSSYLVLSAMTLASVSIQAQPLSDSRVTRVEVAGFGSVAAVRRVRAENAHAVQFKIPKVQVPRGAVLDFEAVSTSPKGDIPRFRCMAELSSHECFRQGLRLVYLPGDAAIILRVTSRPREDPLVLQYFAEQRLTAR